MPMHEVWAVRIIGVSVAGIVLTLVAIVAMLIGSLVT
jgi:hypothetical protein